MSGLPTTENLTAKAHAAFEQLGMAWPAGGGELPARTPITGQPVVALAASSG